MGRTALKNARMLIAVLLCGLAGGAQAQSGDVPDYDVNQIVYEPQQVSLPDCGLSLGADRSWVSSVRHEDRPDKGPRTLYDFDAYLPAFQVRARPFDVVTALPLYSVLVICSAPMSKGVGLKGDAIEAAARKFAASLYASHEASGKFQGATALQPLALRGLKGALFYAHRDVANGDFTAHVFGWTAQRQVFITVVMTMPSAKDLKGTREIPAGTVVREKLGSGKVLSVRMLSPARKKPRDAYLPTRSYQDNLDFTLKMLSTLRPAP